MFEVRPIAREEVPAFIRVHTAAMGRHPTEAYLRSAGDRFERQRDIGAFEDGQLIGSSVIHWLHLQVPDGAGGARSLPTGGVTNVAVLPTHRRRGALQALMRDHMTRLHEEGTALAVLWASESLIYRRFGYGRATGTERWSIAREHTTLRDGSPPDGHVVLVGPDEARALWPEVMRRALAGRPGYFPRTPDQWETFFDDDPDIRDGGSAHFHVVYRDAEADQADGYATYRVHRRMVDRIFQHELRVTELMATTAEATRGLWRYIFGVDLIAEVTAQQRPLDDPLPWMLLDPRRLRRSVQDGLWLRLVDVPAALEARGYACHDSLVLDVRDEFCEWNTGRYRLEASPGGARCTPTTDTPDLSMDVPTLAAAYLGGARFQALAATGDVEGAPSVLARADALFATHATPWCPVFF
ncbi:MAG: GNAT family N-acetyltransferase [Dehalococcoidia bacterium]